jgi:hypothetical protein
MKLTFAALLGYVATLMLIVTHPHAVTMDLVVANIALGSLFLGSSVVAVVRGK